MKEYIHNIGSREFKIKIGRNAQENWDLVDNSENNDLWLHLDKLTSPHVIIQEISLNKPDYVLDDKYPNSIIQIASQYCKKYSKYKDTQNLKIVYTEISNITKGNVVGLVYVTNGFYINI